MKNGGKENTEERRFRSRGGWLSHNTGTSPPPSPPPPLLCHSGLDYFILIRLIPSIEVSCSSPPPLPPPPLLLLQTRAISFQREDRMRASLRLIGEKNVKGETEIEALTAAVSGGGGGLNEKIWASAV